MNKNESIEEGLKKEESFFNNTYPWKNIQDKNLLGTKKLRAKLAQLQMDMIRSSFPSIALELRARQDETMKEYMLLGDIPSNLAEKRTLFGSVKEEIWKGIGASVLSGDIPSLHDDGRMRPSAEFLDASQRYQEYLNQTKLATVSDIKVGTLVVIAAEKEVKGIVRFIDDVTEKVYINDPVAPKDVTSSFSGIFVGNKPGDIVEYQSKGYSKSEDGKIIELTSFERKLARPDPEWISVLIERNRPYKLPVFINTDVFEAIVADLIDKEWAPPSMALLDFTSRLMDKAAEAFIKKMRRVKSFPGLESFLVGKTSEIVDSLMRVAREKVGDFIKREQVPFTQNHYLFENVCKLRSQRLMDEVLSAIKGQYGTGTANITVNPASLLSMIRNIFERNQRRSVQDHMAEEMQTVLNSYGKVALKRFIDNVPMICIEIMQKFADKMNDVLSRVTDNEIDRIVSVPRGIIETREVLKVKADKLEKGILALREVY